MKTLQFITALCLITLLAACTKQVETDLPEPETTNVTTDDEREVVLRSTQQECDDYQMFNLSNPPKGSEIAELLECRLNQGVDEAHVQANCTFSETYSYDACHDEEDIRLNYGPIVEAHKDRVAANTANCPSSSCAAIGATGGNCRTVIFTVTFLNDDDCPGAPDEWEFHVVADVYCC